MTPEQGNQTWDPCSNYEGRMTLGRRKILVEGLYLTYGVLFGMGASLTYTPSLVILGHYFKRYMGIVNGFVTAGSSVFTVIMTFALDGLLKHVALVHCFQVECYARWGVLAALMALVMPCALLFKPLPVLSSQPQRCDNSLASQLKSLVNVDIWKRRKYVIWALVVPLALFGYFVPYVHMVKFVEIKFPESDGKLLVMCIGITSGVGRLIFGKIADIPRVNRIFLQQISFLSIGLLTMLLTVTNSFALLVIIALCMGIFDGCFISLLGPIAFEICGHKGATQAIGFLLGFCSIPLTLGPPIAGLIFDHTNSYYIPFLLAGVPPILGALALFAVCCVSEEDEKKGVSLAMVDASTPLQNGKGPVLDKTRGTWVQVLATSYTSATSPYYIPECHHLLTSPGHQTGSLQCYAQEDENKMEETDAPHCNGDVIPIIDEEYQDSEEEQSLMGEVKKISVQSTA
uniref:Monocarboxylate transporter 10 n=1 Tax=Timema genevievae TaxID=629358 RepID=A0A7R9PP51_TIMGE|nr:unnamed protein product [Timema genevievae]